MNRRDFLTSLFGATTAAVMLPYADVLASPIYEPLTAKAWDDTFQQTLREAWRLFQAHHGSPAPDVIETPDRYIGHVVSDGRMFTDRFHVACTTDPTVDFAMAVLAHEVKTRNLSMLGVLPLPKAVDFAGLCGGLRMVVCYSIETDALITRFDVIGGKA